MYNENISLPQKISFQDMNRHLPAGAFHFAIGLLSNMEDLCFYQEHPPKPGE